MSWITALYVFTALCWMAYFVIGILRIKAVGAYRRKLIDTIGEASQQDILDRCDYGWRWEAFSAVSFDDMVKQWRRPLGDFYPDKRFLDPTVRGPRMADAGAYLAIAKAKEQGS
jgi:hypothetical protein